jgi:hypothetical protein
MRKLSCIVVAAALSGLALASPAVSSPLSGGLTSGKAAVPELDNGFVQKVHGSHCRSRKGWYHGHRVWHRHRRACYDDDYEDYSYSPSYGGYPYGYGYSPFVFGFSVGDNHHRRRHHKGNW